LPSTIPDSQRRAFKFFFQLLLPRTIIQVGTRRGGSDRALFDQIPWSLLNLSSDCYDRIVREWDDLVSDICIHSAFNVDKLEMLFHVFRHSNRETREFLANVLLERGTAPASHFLYLSIGVTRQGERICATAPQRVCVYALNWDAFEFRVLESYCCLLEAAANVLISDVKPCCFDEEGVGSADLTHAPGSRRGHHCVPDGHTRLSNRSFGYLISVLRRLQSKCPGHVQTG